MNNINLNEFLKVFNKIWCEYVNSGAIPFGTQNINNMNEIIFGDDGIISKITEHFNNEPLIKCLINHLGLNVIITSDKKSIIDGVEYPLEVRAAIKQVKDCDVIQSAWELIHLRTHLKVLVIYDVVCANTTLSNICSILDEVDDFNVESDNTEYLFLLSHQGAANDPPSWLWSSSHQRGIRDVTSDGALDRAKEIAKEEGLCGVNLPQRFEYSFELNQPYEDAISLHGALHRKINRIVDAINLECKQAGLSVDNSCIRITNIE